MIGAMRVGVLLALAGCDAVLGLEPIAPPPPGGPATLAAGYGHTCWVRNGDHALFCWGENDFGQLGIPGVQFDAPQPVSGSWLQVSTAKSTTCGIQTDHSLWCWGDNGLGEAGTGGFDSQRSPGMIAGKWKRVTVGAFHTCAIDDQDALWCWGRNTYGELGDGTQTTSATPLHVGDGITAVATGWYHTCAIHTDQTMTCWGYGGAGQLGNGGIMSSLTPVSVSDFWLDVAAGEYHTCARTREGRLRCWGSSYAGEIGIADSYSDSPATVLVDSTDRTDWIGITANDIHTCAWTATSAWCFGDSSHGELGFDGNAFNPVPTALAGGPWNAISLGENHLCALDKTGALSCAGAGGFGQLGHGDTSQLAPILIATGTWNRVTGGAFATCAIDLANHASCGGNNFYGGLGVGDRVSRRTLAPLDPASTWNDISLGTDHALGIDTGNGNTGHPYGWGDNGNGMSGFPQATPLTTSPTGITLKTTLTDAQQVRSRYHGCAIDDANQLSCWGPNNFGELAMPPSDTPQYTPGAAITTATEPTWNRVGVGAGYTCAIGRTSQQVFCWGRNSYGQLGDGTTTDHYMPAIIGTTRQFGSLAIGYIHACGKDLSGAVWCWGYNGEGQVGNGGTSQATPPQMVTSASGWKQVTVGLYHSCAIRGDGRLACWGDNRRGQLGNGDTARAPQLSPVLIGTDTDWIWVSAGFEHTCAIRMGGNVYCWGSNNDGQLLDDHGWTAQFLSVDMPP